jgi:hypothetical protein
MPDLTVNKATLAPVVHERARVTTARSSGETRDAVTGLVLLLTSIAACALLVLEMVFCLLWALGGEFRTWVSFLH